MRLARRSLLLPLLICFGNHPDLELDRARFDWHVDRDPHAPSLLGCLDRPRRRRCSARRGLRNRRDDWRLDES